MMNQFEVLSIQGERYLCVVNPGRYDFWLGFRTVVKRL